MNMLVDAIFVVIFVYFAIKFYKIGIFGTILGVGRLLLSFVTSFLLGKYVYEYIVFGIMSEWVGRPVAQILGTVVSYVLVFIVAFAVSSIVIVSVKKLETPLISRIDRSIGLIFGLSLGLCITSVISTTLYSALDLISSISGSADVLRVYNDSAVFKFVYDLNFLNFVRNLI